VNEIACPNIVLESGRLLDATVASNTWLFAEFPRLFPPRRPFQPEFDPEPMDPLEIHRPALAAQHHVDSPVAESGMSPGQASDLTDQRRVVGSAFPIVSQGRSRAVDHPTGSALRDLVLLGQVSRDGSLLVGSHHFFSTALQAARSRLISPFQVGQELGTLGLGSSPPHDLASADRLTLALRLAS
jgi:hypothetical protein